MTPVLLTISDSNLLESQNRIPDRSVSGATVSFPAVIIGARLVAVDGLMRGGSMESLVLEVRNPDTVNAIAEAAKRQGTTPEAAALELLETAVLAQRPFEEIVEPIAKSFDESGMTEEDLDDLIAQTTKAARKEGVQNK